MIRTGRELCPHCGEPVDDSGVIEEEVVDEIDWLMENTYEDRYGVVTFGRIMDEEKAERLADMQGVVEKAREDRRRLTELRPEMEERYLAQLAEVEDKIRGQVKELLEP